MDLFAANHRLEHGGLDLVNTNFDSDRAYGVISDSKGSRGISDSKGSRGHIGGLDGVRSDSHSKSLQKHPRYHATCTYKKKTHNGYCENSILFFVPNTSQLIFCTLYFFQCRVLACTLIFD